MSITRSLTITYSIGDVAMEKGLDNDAAVEYAMANSERINDAVKSAIHGVLKAAGVSIISDGDAALVAERTAPS